MHDLFQQRQNTGVFFTTRGRGDENTVPCTVYFLLDLTQGRSLLSLGAVQCAVNIIKTLLYLLEVLVREFDNAAIGRITVITELLTCQIALTNELGV